MLRTPLALLLTLSLALSAMPKHGRTAAVQSDAADGGNPVTPATAAGAGADRDKGCWARFFLHENYEGSVLRLVGPVDVANLTRHSAFPRDALYESLEVVPEASLAVFDNPGFRERTMVFVSGQRVADLDNVMGLFRTIRSVKLRCPRQ